MSMNLNQKTAAGLSVMTTIGFLLGFSIGKWGIKEEQGPLVECTIIEKSRNDFGYQTLVHYEDGTRAWIRGTWGDVGDKFKAKKK